MKNLIIGIIIGIVLITGVKTAFADNPSWNVGFVKINKFVDGKVNCYVAYSNNSWATAAISCVKMK